MSTIQKFGWVYFVMFLFIASLNYIPGLTDESGSLFGLFVLDTYDDLLHLGSGIWAGLSAWRSTRAAILYFKLFGLLYFGDSLLGLATGQGYLDGGIFLYGATMPDLLTRVLTNLPHVLIGGIALYIGFVYSRRASARTEI